MLKRLGVMRREYTILHPQFWFGSVDSRPLSVFRIAFALLLLKDALYHIPIAGYFYSDTGFMPRAVYWEHFARSVRFSLMDAMPHTWMAQAFFALWVLVLIGLLLGYRTRWMALLNFLIIMSVHERHLWVLNGGDTLMRVLSFWMLFVPLAHYYSLDALRTRWRRALHSGDTTALRPSTQPRMAYAFPLRVMQIQVAFVYLFTWLEKLPGAAWANGEALHRALQVNQMVSPAGEWVLYNVPLDILGVFTSLTILLEGAFFFAVFAPIFQPYLRAAVLLGGVGLHIGIALLMAIPNFSILMLITYILFLHPAWLRWLDDRLKLPRYRLQLLSTAAGSPTWYALLATSSAAVYHDPRGTTTDQALTYDGWRVMDERWRELRGYAAWRAVAAHLSLSRLWAWTLRYAWVRRALWHFLCFALGLRTVRLRADANASAPAQSFEWAWLVRVAVTALTGTLLISVTLHNLSYVEVNGRQLVERPGGWAGDALRTVSLYQRWNMFSPYPPTRDRWLLMIGTFEDGTQRDLMTGQLVSGETSYYRLGPMARFRKYFTYFDSSSLSQERRQALMGAAGAYHCRAYNVGQALRYGQRLATLEIHLFVRRSVAPGQPENPYTSSRIWRHWCYPEYEY